MSREILKRRLIYIKCDMSFSHARIPIGKPFSSLLYPDQQFKRSFICTRDLTPATACTCSFRPRHVATWTVSFIYFSLPWTRALGPTKRGRRGATLSAYPDANEGWPPQPYRFCAPLFLIHMPHLSSSTLTAILAINANKLS